MTSYSDIFTLLPEGIDKYAAFGEIVRNCHVFDNLDDKYEYLDAVIRREKLQSTGIGHGVAIAHGKVAHLGKTFCALGFSKDGILFDDIFEERVHLVFLLASCPTKPSEYVKALGALLSWVHDEEFRSALINQRFNDKRVKEFFKMIKRDNFYSFNH